MLVPLTVELSTRDMCFIQTNELYMVACAHILKAGSRPPGRPIAQRGRNRTNIALGALHKAPFQNVGATV